MSISLPMYDLPEVAADTDALIEAIGLELLAFDEDDLDLEFRLDTTPERPANLHEHWVDPLVALSQTCSHPLIGFVQGSVLGTFAHRGFGGRYRSVVVGAPGRAPERAAANEPWSFSGWISLLAATGNHEPWPGEVVWTGSHRASLAALRDGRADVASIDAVTFELLRQHAPDEVAGLEIVGHGPEVAELPLITSHDFAVAELRDVLRAVVDSDALAPHLERLQIEGFVPLDREDYIEINDIVLAVVDDYPPSPMDWVGGC